MGRKINMFVLNPVVSPSDEVKFANLAAIIEDNIFKEHKDTGTKYKSRVRSRVSNLGDLKNPNLRERVICGDITPARIATMTTEVNIIQVDHSRLFWLLGNGE